MPRWAYRTYDCIPRDPSLRLQGVDLFIADGINGRLSGRIAAGLLAAVDEVSAALADIPEQLKFWDLEASEVPDVPSPGTRAWPVWRALTVLMGTRYCGVAVTHKTLHHKRPDVFPLIDRRTLPRLGTTDAWRRVHNDLVEAPDAWAELERGSATRPSIAVAFHSRAFGCTTSFCGPTRQAIGPRPTPPDSVSSPKAVDRANPRRFATTGSARRAPRIPATHESTDPARCAPPADVIRTTAVARARTRSALCRLSR